MRAYCFVQVLRGETALQAIHRRAPWSNGEAQFLGPDVAGDTGPDVVAPITINLLVDLLRIIGDAEVGLREESEDGQVGAVIVNSRDSGVYVRALKGEIQLCDPHLNSWPNQRQAAAELALLTYFKQHYPAVACDDTNFAYAWNMALVHDVETLGSMFDSNPRWFNLGRGQ